MKIETEIKRAQRNLPCRLTREELLEKGKTQAELLKRKGELENEKKRCADDFKARLSEVDSQMTVLSNEISTGVQYRNVPITIVIGEPDADHKTISRDDTCEVIETSNLTPEERQLILPMPKDA